MTVLTDSVYSIGSPSMAYSWTFDQAYRTVGGSLVDCGAYTQEFFDSRDLSPLDPNLFHLDFEPTEQLSTLTVKA